MLALASVTVAVIADEKAVVLKDTRQCSRYAQLIGIKTLVMGGEWEIRAENFAVKKSTALVV